MKPPLELLTAALPSQAAVLRILRRTRASAALALLVLCITAQFSDWLLLPMLPTVFCALVLLFWAAFEIHLPFRQPEKHIAAGLFVDSAVLTLWLYYTGGTSNPLISLYLLPVLCAALFCPRRFAWFLTAAAVTVYFLLLFYHRPLPLAVENPDILLQTHLAGMWLTFALSAALLTAGISWLAASLRAQEKRLQAAHRRQQDAEYWLVSGMESATLAHQLSTPLNSLILLNAELRRQTLPEDTQEDLALAARQLDYCRDVLHSLKNKIDRPAAEIDLAKEFARRLGDWQNLRPDVALQRRHSGSLKTLRVRLDESFWSAFFNILNNAAEAGSGEVEIADFIENGCWHIGIHNRSGTLSNDQLARAGLDILESGKPAGMGMGLKLSHATLSRLSGSLTLNNHAEGGVYAEIILPLDIVKNP